MCSHIAFWFPKCRRTSVPRESTPLCGTVMSGKHPTLTSPLHPPTTAHPTLATAVHAPPTADRTETLPPSESSTHSPSNVVLPSTVSTKLDSGKSIYAPSFMSYSPLPCYSRFHAKVCLVAGVGFFTDAYGVSPILMLPSPTDLDSSLQTFLPLASLAPCSATCTDMYRVSPHFQLSSFVFSFNAFF